MNKLIVVLANSLKIGTQYVFDNFSDEIEIFYKSNYKFLMKNGIIFLIISSPVHLQGLNISGFIDTNLDSEHRILLYESLTHIKK